MEIKEGLAVKFVGKLRDQNKSLFFSFFQRKNGQKTFEGPIMPNFEKLRKKLNSLVLNFDSLGYEEIGC